MQNKHYIALAFAVGAVAGYFLMTAGNSYGAGKWGSSTFGWVYSQTANLASP